MSFFYNATTSVDTQDLINCLRYASLMIPEIDKRMEDSIVRVTIESRALIIQSGLAGKGMLQQQVKGMPECQEAPGSTVHVYLEEFLEAVRGAYSPGKIQIQIATHYDPHIEDENPSPFPDPKRSSLMVGPVPKMLVFDPPAYHAAVEAKEVDSKPLFDIGVCTARYSVSPHELADALEHAELGADSRRCPGESKLLLDAVGIEFDPNRGKAIVVGMTEASFHHSEIACRRIEQRLRSKDSLVAYIDRKHARGLVGVLRKLPKHQTVELTRFDNEATREESVALYSDRMHFVATTDPDIFARRVEKTPSFQWRQSPTGKYWFDSMTQGTVHSNCRAGTFRAGGVINALRTSSQDNLSRYLEVHLSRFGLEVMYGPGVGIKVRKANKFMEAPEFSYKEHTAWFDKRHLLRALQSMQGHVELMMPMGDHPTLKDLRCLYITDGRRCSTVATHTFDANKEPFSHVQG